MFFIHMEIMVLGVPSGREHDSLPPHHSSSIPFFSPRYEAFEGRLMKFRNILGRNV